MALGVVGLGCEDALQHLLNFVWPNIFETSPHVINAVFEALEGMRVSLGPAILLQYAMQVTPHPTPLPALAHSHTHTHTYIAYTRSNSLGWFKRLV